MRTTHGLPQTGQRGMVLAVALILLVILTVVGIAAMQSGALQERMAVNQVQSHGTFLDSEQRVWDSADCVRRQYWDDGIGDWRTPESTAFVESQCGPNGEGLARANAIGADVVWTVPDPADPKLSYYAVTAMPDTFSAGSVTPVVMHIRTPGSTGGQVFSDLPRLAPYVCFGEKCELTRASGRSSPTADGFNRLSPNFEENANCGARGNNRPVVDPEANMAVPGVIMPDGIINGTLSTGIDPDSTPAPDVATSSDQEAIINDDSYYTDLFTDEYAGYDYKMYVDSLIDGIIKDEDENIYDGVLTGTRELQGYETGVFLAGPGETITLSSGADAAAGGVIILDGGTLDVTGNQCFAGVVLYRNSGIITSARGTSAFLGTVIGYSGYSDPNLDDQLARTMDPRLNGTPSFYFSDKAIQDAEEVAAELQGGKWLEMVEWRSPVRRLQ